MRRIATLALCALLAATLPALAAPKATPLKLDKPMAHTFSSSDPKNDYGRPLAHYPFTAESGQGFLVTLDSPPDYTWVVHAPDSKVFKDDGPWVPSSVNGKSVSRAQASRTSVVPTAGDYVVTVIGSNDRKYKYGSFKLTVTTAPTVFTAPLTADLAVGQTVSETHQKTDLPAAKDRVGDAFRFVGAAGQEVDIAVEGGIMAEMTLLGADGLRVMGKADPERRYPLRLKTTLAEAGEYRLVVTANINTWDFPYTVKALSKEQANAERAAQVAQGPEFYRQGKAALDAGKNGEAETFFLKALAADHKTYDTYASIATVYERLNFFTEARNNLEEAQKLALNPAQASELAGNLMRVVASDERSKAQRAARDAAYAAQLERDRIARQQAAQRAAAEEAARKQRQSAAFWGAVGGIASAAIQSQQQNTYVPPRAPTYAPSPQYGGGGGNISTCNFNAAFSSIRSQYPQQSHWGARDLHQYTYFLSSQGLSRLGSMQTCMSTADYSANLNALVASRDAGLRGCQQLSTTNSCPNAYPNTPLPSQQVRAPQSTVTTTPGQVQRRGPSTCGGPGQPGCTGN